MLTFRWVFIPGNFAEETPPTKGLSIPRGESFSSFPTLSRLGFQHVLTCLLPITAILHVGGTEEDSRRVSAPAGFEPASSRLETWQGTD